MSDLLDRARAAVRHGGSVLDIGAGIRPQTIVRTNRMLCVEPHKPYADVLVRKGYAVLQTTAELALVDPRVNVDTVVMIDVIEHMEKDEGARVLELTRRCASQVVVFTPLGFIEQTHDAWNMGGEVWQRHRSGWMPDDFVGWTILLDENFHARLRRGAFFAIWQRAT